MRLAVWFSIVAVVTTCVSSHGRAQSTDDDLSIYAVNVAKKAPLQQEFVGFGIYLGNGTVITAAHVVGHFPLLTHPHVRIAGLDLPAQVVKNGAFEETDLALLSVDAAQLPVSLRLRRNPLCKGPAPAGTKVIVVYPKRTDRSLIIPPLYIAPQYRARLNSLIAEAESSGSGVFHSERRCLLGIISQKVPKFSYQKRNGLVVASPAGYAGYFIPASTIAAFIPPEFRF
jgi:hypothetical protein